MLMGIFIDILVLAGQKLSLRDVRVVIATTSRTSLHVGQSILDWSGMVLQNEHELGLAFLFESLFPVRGLHGRKHVIFALRGNRQRLSRIEQIEKTGFNFPPLLSE
jgi:hypothetical protein